MPGHLIHVGFPKAGSTSLQDWFTRHPDLVHNQPHRLGGYEWLWQIPRRLAVDPELPDRWHVSSSELLIGPPPDVPGDPTSLGVFAERREGVCRTLRALCGGATILIVTRGYRSFLGSLYTLLVRGGTTDTPAGMIAGMGDNFEALLDYDAAIALYEGAFGDNNVFVLPYELLRDDPTEFLGLIEDRLDMERSGLPIQRLNPSLTAGELYWYPRFSRVARTLSRRLGKHEQRALDLYGERIGGPDLRRAARLLDRVGGGRATYPAQAITAETLERLRGRASSLASLPVYAPYRAEYLNDEP